MDINEVYEYLNTYGKSGKSVENLTRVKALLNELGNPQDKLQFIHVAGTNGKGSVCEMLTEALTLQGYRTGTFTSPYILEYADRIRVNKQNIQPHYLIRHAQRVKACAERTPYGNDYSQFEITMCIALEHFVERACDVVVWETGIGGLNDCTNVIKAPLVSVICSVSYDHTAVLGDTLEQIAYQKAGIIKKHCPVVLSCGNDRCVEDIVRRTAILNMSDITVVCKNNIRILSDTLDGCCFEYKKKRYRTSMCGVHQSENAVSVIEALHACRMSLPVSEENIQMGIASARLHARSEVISKAPLIILDGGHNPDCFDALRDVLQSKTATPRAAVLGMLNTKDYSASLDIILPTLDLIITTDSFHPNAVSAGTLAEEIKARGKNACAIPDVHTAIERLAQLSDEYSTGVICGSLYLASEVLSEQSDKLAPQKQKELFLTS